MATAPRNALDEAAYLILHTLQSADRSARPVARRPAAAGRAGAVREVIETRIATRKPASYLTNEAWIGGHSFYVDERVIVPRSYIGELLCRQMEAPAGRMAAGIRSRAVGAVLDLCTGSGCLAILAALAFPDATDRCQRHLARMPSPSPRATCGDYGLEERISLVQLRPVRRPCRPALRPHHRQSRPTSAPRRWRRFPPEYAAEPRDRPCRRRRRPRSGAPHPRRGRRLPVARRARCWSRSAPAAPCWSSEFPHLPFLWLDTAESEGEVFVLAGSSLALTRPSPRPLSARLP